MKLIKLTNEHYIICDDSEIKEGDWLYSFDNGLIVQANKGSADTINSKSLNGKGYGKITHSTQPLYKNDFWAIQELKLSEVKELIGEVDVEKKAEKWFLINQYNQQDMIHSHRIPEYITTKNLWVSGYNQAIEDNKDKKYTEEDVIAIVEKSRATGLTAEYIIQSLQQPKTEWYVEFDSQGKLKLL